VVGFETYFERLGPQGLRLVAAGLLDEAGAALLLDRSVEGLSPAERGRLVVDRLAEAPERGAEALRLFEAAAALPEIEPGGERREEAAVRDELAALLRAPDPSAARLFHRLARAPRPALPSAEIRAAAEVLAAMVLGDEQGTRPKWFARSASDRATSRELEQERRELEARVRQLEATNQRLVERAADLDRELAGRVDEVRELRLAERAGKEERARLEKEIARLAKRIEEQNERRAREQTGVLTTALRRLTTEQRRAAARLEKLARAQAEKRDVSRDQTRRFEELAALVERLADQRDEDARAFAAAQEATLRSLAALGGAAPAARAPRRAAEGESQRVALFVDVQNMFYAAREKGARLDFDALLSEISEGRRLVRAVAYVVETREIDQSAFIHLLQVKKYEVKRKTLRIRPDGSMKGNWDLEIALDALTTSEHVDVVVLVTGDGDFVPLVRELRLHGKTVEVYGFPRSSAPDLREAADRFVAITRRLLRPLAPERRPRREGAPRADEESSAAPTTDEASIIAAPPDVVPSTPAAS